MQFIVFHRPLAVCFLLPLLIRSVVAAVPTSAPEPYIPEPHVGFGKLVSQAATTRFRSDFSPPAEGWISLSGRGYLPAGWLDLTPLSGKVHYSRSVFDGVPMFHIEASGTLSEKNAVRASIPLGTLSPGTICKIRIRTRSTTGSPVSLSILAGESENHSVSGTSKKTTNDISTSDRASVIWHQTIPAGINWKENEFIWIATPPPSPALPPSPSVHPPRPLLIAIGPERSGSCDIFDLVVETIDRGRFETALDATRHAGGDNLLPTTRFPLGLPPRWLLDRTTSDDDVPLQADAHTPGPSGIPSLHIPRPPPPSAPDQAASGPVSIESSPFAIARFWQPHTASLSIRGEATGTLRVRSGTRTIATQRLSIAPSDGWKRLVTTFSPRTPNDEYYLQLTLNGEAWIDALRVAPGDPKTDRAIGDYVPPEAEVTLSFPSPARVIFADEPDDALTSRISWAVLTSPDLPAGSILRAKVVNLYDSQVRLPDTLLTATDSPRLGTWILPRFPGQEFGAHRIEAWVETPKGIRIGTPAEIVVYRLQRPRAWGYDAENSPFGIHATPVVRHLAMAKAIGINWVRLHDAGINTIGWYFLEPERGRWSFNDKAIRRYRDQHLMILGQLGTAPAWATALQQVGPSDWLDRYYRPQDLDAFRNYVRTVATRYRQQIRYWEVWNEPWLASFWKSGRKIDAEGRIHNVYDKDSPAAYAHLTRLAVDAAHQADPALHVIGVNTKPGTGAPRPGRSFSGEDWTRQVAAAGGLEGLAAMSWHLYITRNIGYANDWVEISRKQAFGPVTDPQTRRPSLPVWMTEGSAVQRMTGRGFYYQSLPFPDATDDHGLKVSDQLLRYVTTVLAGGSEKIFLYSMHKYGFFDDGTSFRVLVSEDGYLHPSAAAFSALAWRLEGKRFTQAVQVTSDTRAYVFRDSASTSREWTAVLIRKDESTPSTLSLRDLRASSADSLRFDDIFGNPLPVDRNTAPSQVFFVTGTGRFSPEILTRSTNLK
ncbi:hypothetical protein OpiT1DRAFT_04992 [Opitutaceae bacterium TAV1]|nr:hypothetical protein OpiT1DRAFT_04992 [Opitutaceae bacterium TAV1]